MAREHASGPSPSVVPFSRSWTTANTSLTSTETFASCLSKLPPIPSRAIVAAALSKSADACLQSINESFPNLLEWPTVIAHSVYPQSSLPPDHHPLDISSLSSSYVSFTDSFPLDSTAHAPLELVKLGFYFSPSNPDENNSSALTSLPTVAQYNLQPDVQPFLDYLSELDPEKSSQARPKQKSRLSDSYAPIPKTQRSINVFATIPMGRNKSSLGSPNLTRRNRHVVNRSSSDLVAAAQRLKVSARTRATPRRTPSGPVEVINLDDDVENDNFSLGNPAAQPTTANQPFALRSQPPPTLETRSLPPQTQPEKPHPKQPPRGENGAHGDPTGVDHAGIAEVETPLGSGEVIIARSKPLSKGIDPLVEEDQIAPATQDRTEDLSTANEPETQDLLIVDNVRLQPAANSTEVTAADAENDDEVMEVSPAQTNDAATTGYDSCKELGWKKQPDYNNLMTKIRQTREKEGMKKAQRQEPVKLDPASLPDSGYSALQKRHEIQENKKKQADKAAEKKRKALEKALERRKRIARRKRKAAAEARGEVYNSDSEENTDPAEPEDTDMTKYPKPANDATGASAEVIDLVGNAEPSLIGQRRGPSTAHGYPPQAKRQRLDHQNQQYGSDRAPSVDGGTFGYRQETRDQGSWQKGNVNRGMPPAQYAYTGGNVERVGTDRLNPRNFHPAQGLPRHWSTPEQDPEGTVMLNPQHSQRRQMPPPSAPFQTAQGSSPPPPSIYPPMNLRSNAHPPPHQMEQRQGFRPGDQFGGNTFAGPPGPYNPREYGGAMQGNGERRRLSPPLFEEKRKELLDHISGVMGDLEPQDRRVIEDFLDNQRYMFARGETEKDFRLQLRNRVLTKLRINKETGEWVVVRARV